MFFFKSTNNLTSLLKYGKNDFLFSIGTDLYINDKLLRSYDFDIGAIYLEKKFIIIIGCFDYQKYYSYLDKDTFYDYNLEKEYDIKNLFYGTAYINDSLFQQNYYAIKIKDGKKTYIETDKEYYFCVSKYRCTRHKFYYKNTVANIRDNNLVYVGNLSYYTESNKIMYKRKYVGKYGDLENLTQYKVMRKKKINIFF